MRNLDDRELALECLQLANHPELPEKVVVERAQAFYDFVTGAKSATDAE